MDPLIPVPRSMRLWGVIGAAVAALFAVWMFFFPSLVPTHFAWVVEPRLAQAFIGAGYVFRTFFFLQFVFARNWLSIRWTFYGNLVFTGTLLLATLWHADEMNWRFPGGARVDPLLHLRADHDDLQRRLCTPRPEARTSARVARSCPGFAAS